MANEETEPVHERAGRIAKRHCQRSLTPTFAGLAAQYTAVRKPRQDTFTRGYTVVPTITVDRTIQLPSIDEVWRTKCFDTEIDE